MFMFDSVLQRDRFPLRPENDRGVKRNSDGHVRCTCKGACKNKLCGCKKIGSKCTKECKCNHSACQNQDQVILYYYFFLLMTYNYQIKWVLCICSMVYPQVLSKRVVYRCRQQLQTYWINSCRELTMWNIKLVGISGIKYMNIWETNKLETDNRDDSVKRCYIEA